MSTRSPSAQPFEIDTSDDDEGDDTIGPPNAGSGLFFGSLFGCCSADAGEEMKVGATKGYHSNTKERRQQMAAVPAAHLDGTLEVVAAPACPDLEFVVTAAESPLPQSPHDSLALWLASIGCTAFGEVLSLMWAPLPLSSPGQLNVRRQQRVSIVARSQHSGAYLFYDCT